MHFERDFEFSPAIVWDALIDPDLVAGWLAEARIDPVLGGQYSLRWMTRPGASTATSARARRIRPRRDR